jgi:hypothetical protein
MAATVPYTPEELADDPYTGKTRHPGLDTCEWKILTFGQCPDYEQEHCQETGAD